jgi:hypothetical protein
LGVLSAPYLREALATIAGVIARLAPLSCPDSTGASSTPRPLGSITGVSAYWIARFRLRQGFAGTRKPGDDGGVGGESQISRNCLIMQRFLACS